MIFSAKLPNGFLEQCQQQGLTDDQIIHQISENIKYRIRTKLKDNPAPGYNIAQKHDWKHNIPVIELMMHCKSMVTHGKQTNDAIIQTALTQIRFDINLSDVSSIDKITVNIHNALMRDIPPEVKNSFKLQQVMLKSLLHTLSKSKPALFCKDVHIYIQSRP